jgi:pyruvate dehydrogenase (quinone)
MEKIASELLVERLIDWGVEVVFGLPGDGIWAEACGGLGLRVEKPSDVEGAVSEALTHPGPALLDVRVNPDEPPMPPRVRYDQAKGFIPSFLRGQPRRAAIASTIFRDKLSRLEP